MAGGAWARVWQPGGHDFGQTPVIAPDVSLARMVDAAGDMAGHPIHARRRGPDPDQNYPGSVRATAPARDERFGDALATQLTAAEKQALDLLAGWPLCTTEQLGGLLGGVSDRRVNQVLGPLRRKGLARRDGDALALTDEGLTYLARRDRAAVGTVLDRWSSERTDTGVYAGTALRSLASQRRHQRGLLAFFDMLCSEVAFSQGYELLDLLPTHRSQIAYRDDETRYVIHPDALLPVRVPGRPALVSTRVRATCHDAEARAGAARPPIDATSRAGTRVPTTAVRRRWCCSCSRRSTPRESSSTPPPACPTCRWRVRRPRCSGGMDRSVPSGAGPLFLHPNAAPCTTSRGVTICRNAVRGTSSRGTRLPRPWDKMPHAKRPSLLHIRGAGRACCTYAPLPTPSVSPQQAGSGQLVQNGVSAILSLL